MTAMRQRLFLFPSDNGQDAAETVSDGWEKTDGGWVYYRNGELHTGWLLDGGDWYYLNPETGLMVTRIPDLRGKNLLSAGGWKDADAAEDVYAG